MALYELAPKLPPFGLRKMLLRVHVDLFTIHRYVLPWAHYYPPELTNLEKLVLVLEDRRFLRHVGIDSKSLARELIRALTFKRHGGASTIDMQFVRTATGYKKRTIKRKLYEMMLSVVIQYRYSKVTILRSYLNCAFFGSGLVGAKRAASRIFSSNHEYLTIEQAALLAAMLVYPRPLKGGQIWLTNVRRRADYGIRIYIAGKQSFDQLPG
jgi:membrane peptidoglycan carboxypeptidase